MVQSVLFLLLGFLSAILIVLLIAPAVWRRAVLLTQRRIEASVPLSLNEMRAARDQVRAEAAIEIRKLEIANKALNEKTIGLKTEISKRLDDIQQLNDENNEQTGMIESLRAEISCLNSKLEYQQDDNERLAAQLASACDQIENKIAEIDQLARLHDEVSLVSSNRQIDLVAAEAKVEKLSGEVDALKQIRDEMEEQTRELSAQVKVAERSEQLKDQKIANLESRLEKVVSTLSDSEEKLDRREKELVRLKEALKQREIEDADHRRRFEETSNERTRYEAAEDRAAKEEAVARHDDSGELAARVGQLEDDKARLEARLKKIVAENRRLKSGDDVDPAASKQAAEAERNENAELRAQINHLAAEIVNLTALLDGPNSEISSIIRGGKGRNDSVDRSSSIADRVRALREAALSSHRTGVE